MNLRRSTTESVCFYSLVLDTLNILSTTTLDKSSASLFIYVEGISFMDEVCVHVNCSAYRVAQSSPQNMERELVAKTDMNNCIRVLTSVWCVCVIFVESRVPFSHLRAVRAVLL